MKKYMIYCIVLMICIVAAVGCGNAAEPGEKALYEQTAEAGAAGETSDGHEETGIGRKAAGDVSKGTSGEAAESGDMVSGENGGTSGDVPNRTTEAGGDRSSDMSGDAGAGGISGSVSGERSDLPGVSDGKEGIGGDASVAASGAKEDSAASGMPGALSVSGTQLADALGNPVQLRGISTHGLAWYPEYVNAECFRQFREEWGMNVVRLAMYTGENGGYCTGGNRDELKELVKNGVAYATDCGMYVIIDWHILSDGNPNTYLEEAKAFFGEMAESYGEYTNVLYEICNEPNRGTSWSDVKKYAEQVIEVIREKDEDGIILVGTPNWCQYVEQAAADPVTGYENIMYTLHFYAATHTDGLRDAMVKAVEDGLPVFVSEYGICDASGSGAIDTFQADKWMELLDEYGISSVAWNLSNKSETSAILRSSCGKVNGFAQEDLSDSGKWLYERMGASGGSAGAGITGGGTGGTAETGNIGSNSGGQGLAGNNGTADGKNGESVSETNGESGEANSQPSSVESAGNTAVSEGLSITAKIINSWGQGSDTYYQYDLSISNPGEAARTEWEIQLIFNCDIALKNGWNGVYDASGNVLIISSMDYNGYIDGNGSVENVGFIIRAEEDCRLEE